MGELGGGGQAVASRRCIGAGLPNVRIIYHKNLHANDNEDEVMTFFFNPKGQR